MPLAVTHVLSAVILVGLYRDYFTKHRHYFTLHTVLIAGIAGLLPDIDIPLRMVSEFFNFNLPVPFQHGGITHTAFFGLLFLIPGIILLKKQKHKIATYFFVITFGILLHVFLDYLLGGGRYEGIMWFWPLSIHSYKIHLLSKMGLSNIPAALDAVLLLSWLWHEEIKHKIRDFV